MWNVEYTCILFDCDDTLTKDYVRHMTQFNTNIHKLNLSVFKSMTFPMCTKRPQFSWHFTYTNFIKDTLTKE